MTATAPTANPACFQATLIERAPDRVVLAIPGTSYRLHLATPEPVEAEAGRRVSGRIRARARRVDPIRSGGRYIEPVYGRPRRIQGRVVDRDPAANNLTVRAAVPLVCELVAGQRAADFPIGTLVSFDVEPGAWYELERARPGHPAEGETAVPPGHAPDEGDQPPTHEQVPGGKIRDAGALTDAAQRGMSGQEPPAGQTPVSGDGT